MSKKTTKKAFDFARNSSYIADPDDLIVIGLDTKDGEGHPLYDATIHEPLDPAFVANVDVNGVIVPIALVKHEGRPAIVDGRTRTRAAREVNKRRRKSGQPLLKLTCVMTNGTDVKLRQKRIISNAIRKVVDVVTRAHQAQELLDQGMTIEEVATTFTVTEQAIKSWLAVQGASRDVKRAVIAGQISAGAAAKIAKLEGASAQKEALDKTLAAGGRNSTKAAKRAVAAKTGTSAVISLGKREQRKLLDLAIGGEADVSNDYWKGFADALRLTLGENTTDLRARDVLKKAQRKEAT